MNKVAYTKIKVGKKRYSIILYCLAVVFITALWDVINKLLGFNILVFVSRLVDNIYSHNNIIIFKWIRSATIKATILNMLFFGLGYFIYKMLFVQLYAWFVLKRIERSYWTVGIRIVINAVYILFLFGLFLFGLFFAQMRITGNIICIALALRLMFVSIPFVDKIQKEHIYKFKNIDVEESYRKSKNI